MPNELTEFDLFSVEKRIPEADDILAYYRVHANLCKEYRKEIDYVNDLLSSLRDERKNFLMNDIPKIRKKLEEESIDKSAIDKWINDLNENYMRSLDVSEEFVSNFIVSKTSEFEKELKKRLGRD